MAVSIAERLRAPLKLAKGLAGEAAVKAPAPAVHRASTLR